MALTIEQKQTLLATYQHSTELRTLIAAAGMQAVVDGMLEVYNEQKTTNASSALVGVLTISVADWAALERFISAETSSSAVQEIVRATKKAIQDRDTGILGPLLGALYAAVRVHWAL
jgi:hypothetical protein